MDLMPHKQEMPRNLALGNPPNDLDKLWLQENHTHDLLHEILKRLENIEAVLCKIGGNDNASQALQEGRQEEKD
jgi:hypothetical protein